MAREDSIGNLTPRQALPASPGFWSRIQAFDGRLSIAKGFTAVTLLTGFFGGYFQYLNSYEEKVSTLAKADMQSATSTFVEISNAFAEAEMLQQLIFFDFKALLDAGTDAGEKGMVTQAGNDAFDSYVKARTALRQNSSVFAHKAEIYIDWASDLGRDPATQQGLDGDPLTETLLGNYDFDCDAPTNFANFAGGGRAAGCCRPAMPRRFPRREQSAADQSVREASGQRRDRSEQAFNHHRLAQCQASRAGDALLLRGHPFGNPHGADMGIEKPDQ
jgi:hypothetical protein